MGQVHFCRCHHCGHTSFKEQARVLRCDSCKKTVGQFYYFDDRLNAVYSDRGLRPEYHKHEVKPLYGLTAYWESS